MARSRSLARELERDVSRRRERLQDARRLQETARAREQRLEQRIRELRDGAPGSPGSAAFCTLERMQ